MSYTSVFGGTTVYPTNVGYQAIALAANIQFSWPTEDNTSGSTVALINDVTPAQANLNIRMPSSLNVSTGSNATFNNVGAQTFNVLDVNGNTIVSIPPGTTWTVYLTDNTTAQGAWRIYQLGASISVANAAALAGAGLSAIGAQLNQVIPVTNTSNGAYALAAADLAKLFNWTGAGAGGWTLPNTGTVGNNYYLQLRNSGGGNWTFTPAGGDLINGAATLVMQPGDSCFLVNDGAGNWYTVGLGRTSTFQFDFTTINVAGSGNYVLAGNELNRIVYRLTGLLTGARHIIVPNTIQQYWIDNSTTGAFVLDVGTAAQVTPVTINAGNRLILYCDGTNVYNGDTQTLSFPITVVQGGTGSTTAGGALINLGGTALGISVFTAASQTAAQSALGVYSTTQSDSNAIAYAVALG